ncbi:MAG TPA: hypothetical protein VE978_13290 [Chitinophagales bacterium]|nr:hypothetical protein [Chitinophagales bacterium]
MSANEFNTIQNINDRADIVWAHGKPVDERVNYRKYTIAIYSLFDFYVEVWLTATQEAIEKVHALESEEDWKGFLESVRLKHLM